MGAFKVEVMLHDRELQEFVRQAVADELTPEARYVAERIIDATDIRCEAEFPGPAGTTAYCSRRPGHPSRFADGVGHADV